MKVIAVAIALLLALPSGATQSPEHKQEAQQKAEEARRRAREAQKLAEAASVAAKSAGEEADEFQKTSNEYPEKVTLELDEIDDSSVTPIVDKIEDIKKSGKVKELWIRIHSYGGVIDAGEKLVDAIENAGIPTVCVADHKAMSMGFYVLQACDKRLMTKRTVLMIHEPSGGARGNATQIGMIADYLAKENLALLEMAARRMDMSVAEIKLRAGSTAWFMNWQEALDHKAVDGTVDSRDIPPTIKVEQEVNLLQLLLGGGRAHKENPSEESIRESTDSR